MATTSLLAPCAEHPFGTDSLGRDILVRVIYGARVSLSVGILATAISTAIGLVMGALAGFYGGIWDTIIMRAADIFLAFPYVLFVVSLIAVIGRSLTNVFVAIGILGWPSIARVFRSAVHRRQGKRLRRCRAGYGRLRRPHHRAPYLPELRCLHRRLRDDEHRRRHPSPRAPVVPRHGRHPAHALVRNCMIQDGQTYLMTAPWMMIDAGLAILTTVLAFTLLGDGLRDALDVKMKDA